MKWDKDIRRLQESSLYPVNIDTVIELQICFPIFHIDTDIFETMFVISPQSSRFILDYIIYYVILKLQLTIRNEGAA